jgi:hypothetical protein
VRRDPDRDARSLLEDLIALHGRKGRWFAAAKTAGYLDIALDCAADREAAPATLIRAARDFELKNPAFAAQVALHAITHLRAGLGYESSPLDIDAAVDHLMPASRRIGLTAWAIEELRQLAQCDDRDDPMARRPPREARRGRGGLRLNDWLTGEGGPLRPFARPSAAALQHPGSGPYPGDFSWLWSERCHPAAQRPTMQPSKKTPRAAAGDGPATEAVRTYQHCEPGFRLVGNGR